MTFHDITRVVKRALSRRKVESAGLVLAAALGAGGLVAMGSSLPSTVLAPSAQFVTAAVADQDMRPADRAVQWDLANLDHQRVDSWIGRFRSDLKLSLTRYLERMDKYQFMISTKLAQRGMPQDLIYLAMIESGFNPTAKSPAAASGLWQFIGDWSSLRPDGHATGRRAERPSEGDRRGALVPG